MSLKKTSNFLVSNEYIVIVSCSNAVAGHSNSVKIFLQMRVGDNAIVELVNSSNTLVPLIKAYSDCALSMEEKINSEAHNENITFLWYLMSDSVTVRKYFVDSFGEKIFSKCSYDWFPNS